MEIREWLTTTQVGRLIGRSRRDVLRMVEHERYEYFKGSYKTPGGQWRIPQQSVSDFLDKRQHAVRNVRRRQDGQSGQQEAE